ncbi:MAG: hypothetical protein FWD76_00140, partial [Firmicutes bacterium]|nr:hypothetical protein [Bacillota bacterium]
MRQLKDKQERTETVSQGGRSAWLTMLITSIVVLFCICFRNAVGILTQGLSGFILGTMGAV